MRSVSQVGDGGTTTPRAPERGRERRVVGSRSSAWHLLRFAFLARTIDDGHAPASETNCEGLLPFAGVSPLYCGSHRAAVRLNQRTNSSLRAADALPTVGDGPVARFRRQHRAH